MKQTAENPKHAECHFVHHELGVDWPDIEPGRAWRKTNTRAMKQASKVMSSLRSSVFL